MSEANKPKRDIPLWAGILVVLIGLAVAGWFIWSQVSGFWGGPTSVFQIPGVDPQAAQARTRPPRQQDRQQQSQQRTPNIREVSSSEWRMRATPFSVIIRRPNPDQPTTITISVSSTRLLPPDAQWVAIARTKLEDEQVVSQIGLNRQQVQAFRRLPISMSHQMPLTDTQTQEMQAAFQKWFDAQPPAKDVAATELAGLLRTIGQQQLPEVETRIRTMYEQYQSSVTPEQWESLKQLGVTQ